MNISKILNSLEKSWERDEILIKIKKGLGTDEIVNEFIEKNEVQIKELNTLLSPEYTDLLNQVEQLSTCEAKLVNNINNFNYSKNIGNKHKINEKQISLSSNVPTNSISVHWGARNSKVLVMPNTASTSPPRTCGLKRQLPKACNAAVSNNPDGSLATIRAFTTRPCRVTSYCTVTWPPMPSAFKTGG